MTDHYPTNFEIEIDRPGLTEYWRNMDRTVWGTSIIVGSGFLSMLVFLVPLTENLPFGSEVLRIVVACVISFAGGFLLGALLTAPVYLLFLHKQAEARAGELRVTVEGPFLRIRSGGRTKTDRKLHFRSIVDYSVIETKELEECGIRSLAVSTTRGTLNPEIKIPGVVDCLKTRDLLAEIDALREHRSA